MSTRGKTKVVINAQGLPVRQPREVPLPNRPPQAEPAMPYMSAVLDEKSYPGHWRKQKGVTWDSFDDLEEEDAAFRARLIEQFLCCSNGHVTNHGDPPGSWCVRPHCASTGTVRLGDHPEVVAYMVISEAGPHEDHWTDGDVFRMLLLKDVWKDYRAHVSTT